MDWIKERAKAFAAALAAGMVTAGVRAVEAALDIDVGIETEATLTSLAAGYITYLIPNKPPGAS